VIRQLCQDRVAAEVTARGATPVFPPGEVAIAPDRPGHGIDFDWAGLAKIRA